jgi:AcrR family transcriptional regulator
MGSATYERLLNAAERLFAERGYEGTSMRALADAAEANVAAVNYHFRSKEGLLQAVVARAMSPVNAERSRRLDSLYASHSRPPIEELVRAFVEPGLDLLDHHGDRGPAVARFIGRVLFDPSPRIRQLFADQVNPVEGRFLDALRLALPDRDADTILFGYTTMLGVLALHQAATFTSVRWQFGTGQARESDRDRDRERMVAFLTVGLTRGLPADGSPA